MERKKRLLSVSLSAEDYHTIARAVCADEPPKTISGFLRNEIYNLLVKERLMSDERADELERQRYEPPGWNVRVLAARQVDDLPKRKKWQANIWLSPEEYLPLKRLADFERKPIGRFVGDTVRARLEHQRQIADRRQAILADMEW